MMMYMKNATLLRGKPGKEAYYGSYPSTGNAHWFAWLQEQLHMSDIADYTYSGGLIVRWLSEHKDVQYREFPGYRHLTYGSMKTEKFPEILKAVL